MEEEPPFIFISSVFCDCRELAAVEAERWVSADLNRDFEIPDRFQTWVY